MFRSLSIKLTLAFLVMSLVGVISLVFLAGRTSSNALLGYAQDQFFDGFVEDVTDHYVSTGTWEGVHDSLKPKRKNDSNDKGRDDDRQRNQPPGPRNQPDGPPPFPPIQFVLLNQNGQVVVPGPGYPPGEQVPPEQILGIPIEVDGMIVGTVLTNTNVIAAPTAAEMSYLGDIYSTLGIGALIIAVAGLILGVILIRSLTHPLRELTAATQAMAAGHLEQVVSVRSNDEIGELASAFNQMSADLAEARKIRQQMTADIAHDLRTPLTVLAGYVEALRDGILQPNNDMYEAMHEETQHLQRLIHDLRTLSLADANQLSLNREPTAMPTILEKLANIFAYKAHQQDVNLNVDSDPALPQVEVDAERIIQVLGNLVSNAFRYTPKGGQITLSAAQDDRAVLLNVADNGSGIDPDKLPYIFDRFFRADSSRQQDEGESGLGLAIAKSLVEAHGGTISVRSQLGQGTIFTIALPKASQFV